MKVYLAGPEVFLLNAKVMGEHKKEICRNYGLEGVFPLDVDIDHACSQSDRGMKIAKSNEKLITSCDALIANITPFRGPSADVGTIYEIGYASGQNKLTLAYTNCSSNFATRVRDAYGLKHGEIIDPNGMLIEDFEMVDNLMIDGAVNGDKASIVVNDVPESNRFLDLRGFESCVIDLAKIISIN